ncbi:MAG: AAA family ATPase [Burkholderiales bacterium]|nr:AAA family ATPase [Burkholderiales bacterium]
MATPALAGRRRHLTILFSDLASSTRIGELMEAEDFADLLAQMREACRTVITRHGGVVARIQSDGALAIFGYEGTREDDGRRAVEAALEFNAMVRTIRGPGYYEGVATLQLHSGIHSGFCFVDQGDLERGRIEVLGDVPNTAARLADLARPGEICVSEETLGPASHFFEMSRQTVVQVKGRSQPLSVCTVIGHAKARTRFEAGAATGLAPFVGRIRELEVLQARLRSALNGSPHTLLVIGSAGVGKTRLLDELTRQSASKTCLVMRGFCESYLSAEPFQPFLQIVRALANSGETASRTVTAAEKSAAAIAAKVVRMISTPGSPGQTPAADDAGSFAVALRDAIDAIASTTALLLVIDDWQWADDGSVQVIDAIRALHRPIFIVLASRERDADELAVIRAEHMLLEPLSRDATVESVRNLLPGADPFLVDDIYRDSGGNPLFIEELCHSAAHPTVRVAERQYGSSAWLASLIESRVSRLSPEDAQVVRVASVIGNVLSLDLLSRVVGFVVGEQQLGALSAQDFLYPAEQPGTVRFKHGITREVTYAGVGLRERVAIHLQVAAALDAASSSGSGEDAPEVLAYHFAQGLLPMQAARYAELAGDKAMAAHALDRARLQYVATLDSLDKAFMPDRTFLQHWCSVAQRLGMACVFDALALTDATRLLARGVELARQSGDPTHIARAEYWLAYNCYAKGLGREALQHCKSALDQATQFADDRLLAQLRATLGQILASLGRYEESIPLLDAAIDSKRARSRPGGSVAVGSAFALAIKGSALGDQGRFGLAEECFHEMLELLKGSSHQVVSSVRNWIGVVYLWQGRWADAVAVVEDSMHVAENVRSRLLLAFSKSIWGFGQWRLAGTAEASQAVRDATRWIEARGGALGASLNYGWMLDIGEGRGVDEQRRRNTAHLLRRARQHDHLGVAMGCRALARIAAKAGQDDRVRRYLDLADRAAVQRNSPHERASNLMCAAEIRMLLGRHRDSIGPLDAASEIFESLSMKWHLEQAKWLRARF